ncbi:MAG: hypothetical protein BJ554DRAFT_1846 [Olpidium bornovanus]|uniref:Partial AB-hydrolase lipase domain-containing protein n=1 Tax=Olpidium bornovanus TaxID=278681 RepID=A0A8H8DH43_9FUNG|nr:MAG: hypothetical protein BJ554DRAFT_1846 [Olpidium bornovanus]
MTTFGFDGPLRFVPRSSFHDAAPCAADQTTAPAAFANAGGPRPITALRLPAVGPPRLAAAGPCASASWPVAVVCRAAESLPVLAAQAFAHLLSTLVLSAVLLWAFAVRCARYLSERTGATPTGSARSGINFPGCDAAKAAAATALQQRVAGERAAPDGLQASLENLRRAEVVSSCARDYARYWSFDWEEQHVLTKDGFFLEMQRITAKGVDKRQCELQS